MLYPYEGYRLVTPLDAARVNRTNLKNEAGHVWTGTDHRSDEYGLMWTTFWENWVLLVIIISYSQKHFIRTRLMYHARSLKSWVPNTRTVVLTADVFQLFIKLYLYKYSLSVWDQLFLLSLTRERSTRWSRVGDTVSRCDIDWSIWSAAVGWWGLLLFLVEFLLLRVGSRAYQLRSKPRQSEAGANNLWYQQTANKHRWTPDL